MANIIRETYSDLYIIKTPVRMVNDKMPQLVTRLKCDVGGNLLEAGSWRDLQLQIDEQLDRSA